MDKIKVNGSFVSEKISKIRWLPEPYADADKFVTGSWDSSVNNLKVWALVKNQYSDDCVPKCCDKLEYTADITGLEFIDNDNIVASSSEGFLSLVNINRNVDANILTERKRTNVLHKFASGDTSPCTGISVFDKDIATVGEDGRLNILSSNGMNVLREIKNADSCSLTTVSFVNHKEILTGNRMGVIKLFDIRNNNNDPASTFLISCEDDRKSNCVTCITYHPTQKHIILSGSEEGSITVWDLRQLNFPASYLSAHSHAITEIGFHKTQPTKLFTSSENGELWQWNQDSINMRPTLDTQLQVTETENINPWLNGERAKNKINVTALITGIRKAINTFDAQGSQIICGCDSEAVYYIENMF